jgi:hypothetical protein
MDWELIFWVVSPIVAFIGMCIYFSRQPDRMSDEWMERHKNDWDD